MSWNSDEGALEKRDFDTPEHYQAWEWKAAGSGAS
jgi:hypothetical protein